MDSGDSDPLGWEGYEEVEEEEAQILGTAAAGGVTEASVCVCGGGSSMTVGQEAQSRIEVGVHL